MNAKQLSIKEDNVFGMIFYRFVLLQNVELNLIVKELMLMIILTKRYV